MLHTEDQGVAGFNVCSPFSYNHIYMHVLQTILKNANTDCNKYTTNFLVSQLNH